MGVLLPRRMGKGASLMRVAVDVGFGYVKAVADHGGHFTCPAVIAPDDGDTALDQVWGGGPRRERVTVQEGAEAAQRWLVGSSALNSPGATRPWASDATERVGYDVLVATALAALTPPGAGTVAVDLVLGLPLGLFGSQKDALAARFTDRTWHVQRGSDPAVDVSIASVMVLAQAAGVYYAAALTGDGRVRDPGLLRRTVGIVDVGFRTVDYFVMAWDDEGLHPIPALSGSIDTGMVEVLEAVRRRAVQATGQMVDAFQVEAAIRQAGGRLYAPGQTVDLRPWMAEAGEAVGRRVADQIRLLWGRHLLTMATILLAGGGAATLYPTLQHLHPEALLVDDPALANARGFLAVQAMRRLPV